MRDRNEGIYYIRKGRDDRSIDRFQSSGWERIDKNLRPYRINRRVLQLMDGKNDEKINV